jgi:hypothetical protein
MTMLFAAVRESEIGTNRTSSDVRLESALGGKADSMCSERVFRLVTRLRHRTSSKYTSLDRPRRLPSVGLGQLHWIKNT